MRGVRSTILQPVSDTDCRIFADGLILFDRDGTVRDIGPWGELAGKLPAEPEVEIEHAPACFLVPGFYDLHFHWVQDKVRLQGKASLLEWLNQHAFPEEARFADAEYAETQASHFWSNIFSQGIVGGVVYSSVHTAALESAHRHIQGNFHIGNVLMTMHSQPALQTTREQAIAAMRFGLELLGNNYVISPRFAPATDPDTMKAAAQAAAESGCLVQTHLAETPAEIEWVLGLYRNLPGFSDVRSYTEIYDRCGLVGPRSIFGHGIHLSTEERKLLAERGSIIAHCPTSNAPIGNLGLGSGLFDFRAADQAGLPWGLASDIGGGPYLSPFDVMASFVQQNRDAGISSATATRALYRATVSNAALLGYDATLRPGSPASFVLVKNQPRETTRSNANADEILENLFEGIRMQRGLCESLVQSTWLHGHQLYCAAC